MTVKINVATDLEVKECPVCGVFYAIPEILSRRRQEDGAHWYCPNGHSLIYTESEVQRLRQELIYAHERNNMLHLRLDGSLAELSVKTAELKRVTKRINAGVCPDCHRHFINLERHRKTKHGLR